METIDQERNERLLLLSKIDDIMTVIDNINNYPIQCITKNDTQYSSKKSPKYDHDAHNGTKLEAHKSGHQKGAV